MGIRRRILLSFLGLFTLFFIAALLLSIFLVSGAVERRFADQTDNLVRLINGLQKPALENNLEYLRRLSGAHSFTVGSAGILPSGPGVFRAPTLHGELVVDYGSDVLSEEKAKMVRPFVMMAMAGQSYGPSRRP